MADITFPTDTSSLTSSTVDGDDVLPIADTNDSSNLKDITLKNAARWARDNTPGHLVNVSASRELVTTDANGYLDVFNANEITLTIPLEVDEAFDPGTEIIINQLGAGAVRFAGVDGVTIRTPDNLLLDTQYSRGVLRYIGWNIWQFVRYWLSTSSTPAPVAGDPDTNTPPGHIVSIEMRNGGSKTNADRDQEQLDAMEQTTDVAMFSRRWFWSDIETAEAVYDWSEIKSACQSAFDNGQRLLVFPMWRSFNPVAPTPTWLSSQSPSLETYSPTNGGVYDAHMWDTTVSDAFEAMIVALAAELNDYPGFAGVVMSETSNGVTLTTGECNQFITNLKSIYTTICTEMPNYNHFMLMNFISDSGTRTGEFYYIITDVRANLAALSPQQNNMILSQPDLFPYAKSLSEAPSGTYETDRIHNVFQRVHAAYPDQKISSSMQFDSHKIDPDNTNKPWKYCWPIPKDAVGSVWPVREMFKIGREEVGMEWCFWNWTSWTAQKTLPDAQAVFTEFPTWERAVNLIDPAQEKSFLESPSIWTLSPAGDSLTEDTTYVDGEFSKRAGIASYTWNEDSTTAVRKLECIIDIADLEEDQLYTMQTMVHDMNGAANRNFRLEARLCDGATTLGSTWVADTDTWVNKTMDTQRSQAAYAANYVTGSPETPNLEYYKLQVDFIPKVAGNDTLSPLNNLILRFKIMDDTSTTSFAGANTDTYKIGRCKLFKA